MNHMTEDICFAPWNEPDTDHLHFCGCCNKVLNEHYDMITFLEGMAFCEECDDTAMLRNTSVLPLVSKRTKKLVENEIYIEPFNRK